jgi:hypothetical protein
MEERYPYMRFVINAAQPIAGICAALLGFGGLLRACRIGGFGGIMSFAVTLMFVAIVYVAIQVYFESLRVFLDIEHNTRELLHARERGDRAGDRSGV